MDMQILLADGAAQEGQWGLAYNIARQADDVLAPGVKVSRPAYRHPGQIYVADVARRDSRVERAQPARRRDGHVRPLFARRASRCRSCRRVSTGPARPPLPLGASTEGMAYFQRAAAYPELFYGQLALEQLGRAVPAPGPLPTFAVNPAQRTEFAHPPAGPGDADRGPAGPARGADAVRPRARRIAQQ